MRSQRFFFAIPILAVVASSCGRLEGGPADTVRNALRRTATVPHTAVYTERIGAGGDTTVRSIFQDDFRYAADISINGAPAVREIVSDDALAARVEPKGPLASKAGAIGTGRWLLDPLGAPDVIGAADTRRGDDVVRDAVTVFDFVRSALALGAAIVEFNPQAIDYRPDEDTFPKPDKANGIVRYDVRAPELPSAAQVGGNEAIPGVEHFRKMSIYIKDGYVIRVLENIDVASRLDELERNYRTKFPAGLSRERLAEIAIQAVNAVRTGQGSDPVRVRAMSLEVGGIGKSAGVAIPKDARLGSLASLAPLISANRGGSTERQVTAPGAAPSRQAPGGTGNPATNEGSSGVPDLLALPTAEPGTAGSVSAPSMIVWLVAVPLALVLVALVLGRGRRLAALG